MQKLKDTHNQEEIKSIQGADEPQIMSGKKVAGSEKLQIGRKDTAMTKSELMSTDHQMNEESHQALLTQSELFKSYSDQNHLYLNLTNNMFWFEFGGNKIGRLFVEGTE